MRLPEIFGISGKSKVGHCQRPKIVRKFSEFWDVQKFRKTYRKCYQKTKIYRKMSKIYRNFQKSTVYFRHLRYMSQKNVRKCQK